MEYQKKAIEKLEKSYEVKAACSKDDFVHT